MAAIGLKATVARTPNAALVAVATKSGGYCLIPSLPGRPSIGNSCTSAPESELRTYASPSHVRGSRVWILYGRVMDDGAASLDLRGVGLAEPVPLVEAGELGPKEKQTLSVIRVGFKDAAFRSNRGTQAVNLAAHRLSQRC